MRFINRVSDYPNKKILHVSHASYSNAELSELHVTEEKDEETVGYVRFFGSSGNANYVFVGMNGSKAAIFGIRSVASLVKALGITTFMI